jgi:REP element-mobilizing transposase RayT
MPQSLVKILVHAVFSTKNRVDLILPEIENGLFGYFNGIVENNKSKLILANGTVNHVHLLISIGKTLSISELIGDIKRDSSVWIKQQDSNFKDFHWQEGYGAFSVGQSQVSMVMKYIANQKAHHQQKTFENAYGPSTNNRPDPKCLSRTGPYSQWGHRGQL